jgi:diguanylate cyclase (GGDEF)-like protein/PAS domain S-box-containing protein
MFGLRSARSRAIVAGLMLTLFLAAVTALTVWRTQEQNRRVSELEHTSVATTALEHARAQLYLQTSLLSGLAFSQDPSLVEEYRQAQLALEGDLSLARAEADARGDADQLGILDDLTAQWAQFDAMVNLAIPRLLEMDAAEAAELTASYLPAAWDTLEPIFADIDRLAEEERQDFAADSAAAAQDADLDLWLVIARSAVALVMTASLATVVMLSILRPLASLRLSSRAIASGNLEVRAKESGPEELASLARDFNRMTDALAAKTEEYVTTTNLTGDVIGKVDAQGKWSFLNDAACQFFGKPRERLLGTNATAVLHPDDLEPTGQALREARASKEPRMALVNRVLTPMGTRVVEWNAYPLFDKKGGEAGFQITGRDITERKEAEEALQEAEQRYRELFEEAPAMYVICRNRGGAPIVADCNELFLTTLGYGRDEVVERPVADFYTPESRAQLMEGGAFQRALAGHSVEEERQLVTKDGRIVETVLRAVRETAPNGRVLGTRAMYLDITERKRVEEALRESEARYRLLAENTTDLIWTLDLSLKYTYMSPAITRMRGYSVEEIVGSTVQETMTPASLEVARRTLAEQLALEREGNADPNRSTKLELEMYCKDGSTIWTEMNMTFLRDADGRPTGILGVTRDITERKQAEAALRTKDCAVASSINAIALADLEGTLTYVNPALLKMWGYDDEKEILGRHVSEFWQTREKALRVGKALRDKGSWAGELVAIKRDGSPFYVEMLASTVTDEAGNPVCLMGSFLDISERRQAAAALEESEKRYRLLAENASDIIWTMDMNLRFSYQSPSVTRIRGYSPEEAMALTIEETLTPASLEVARKALAEELAPGKMETGDLSRSRTLQLEHRCKDGSTVWLEVTTSFLRDEDGRPIGLLGVSRDITERKQGKEALEESEKRYRLLAENASDIIWTMDMNLCFTYQSPSVTRIRGFTPEEAMAQTIEETLTPASLEVARKALAEELAPGKMETGDLSRSRTLQLEQTCKDGSTVWLEVTTSFLRDEDGRPIGLLGVSRDITERKRAEEELRESEMRFRQVAEASHEWIWEVDAEGRYTYASPAVQEILGYEPQEVIGKPYYDFYPAEEKEQLLAEDREILARKATFVRVIDRRVHKDGHTVLVESTGVPVLSAKGDVLGYRGVDEDVTERKRAEEERERLHAELEARAVTDSLTGLYNHAYFYQRLGDEIDRSKRYGHRFALVMMDVDAFKHYNDSRGHQAGDTALRLVGECIRSAMRRSDLAFRYGGDEFVAILLNADVPKAQDIVRRINRRIATRLKEAGDSAGAWLGVSAGIACYPADATTVDELVRMADTAMYDAKRLAWARGVMGRGQAIASAACPVETVHQTQAGMLSSAASSLAAALQDLAAPAKVAESDLRTIAALGAAAEIKDPYILGHHERTSRLAATLAKQMGLSPERVRNITTAGLLHDLGKVGVGETILNKPGKLTKSEFAKMKEHPALGASMIVSGARALQPLEPIVRHHHEHFDGSGYPDGLARENIPLEARILSVADAFDAMTHERAYRKALSTDEALGEIERGAGNRFDRAVVEAFLGVFRKQDGGHLG